MDPRLHHLFADATRLTRAGDLLAATNAIQAALQRLPATPSVDAGRGDVIDVEATVVDRPLPQPPRPRETPGRGGRFVAGSHGSGAARRDYKLFIPARAHEGRALPLVVMLHGCAQTPDDFAAGTAMNEHADTGEGCYVLYPAQSRQVNPQGCWNWFKHNHQQRGRGEPALLAAMTSAVIGEHAVDRRRVYVAGLSAGGAMAAILGQAYPELFAAVGVHSGLAAGAARDLPSALNAMQRGSGAPLPRRAVQPPTIVFHGDADATVHPSNGDAVEAAAPAGSAETVARSEHAALACTTRVRRAPDGRVLSERWLVHGAGHAWSGGRAAGSYTEPRGPDASAEMLRFFRLHTLEP